MVSGDLHGTSHLTKAERQRQAEVIEMIRQTANTDVGRLWAEYLYYALIQLRLGMDDARGDNVLLGQGAIAFCKQVIDHMRQPVAPTQRQASADPRTPEERAAAPDSGY